MANIRNRIGRNEGIHPFKRQRQKGVHGMVKVSEFDQTLGKVGIPHAVIMQHAGSWLAVIVELWKYVPPDSFCQEFSHHGTVSRIKLQ